MPAAPLRRSAAAARSPRKLTVPAQTAAVSIAAGSGLNLDVVRAWIALESAYGTSRLAREQNNFLGLKGGGAGGRSFRTFLTPLDFSAAVVAQLAKPRYSSVMASRSKGPAEQIKALALSPWSESHYGGGAHLANAYRAVTGRDPGSTTLQDRFAVDPEVAKRPSRTPAPNSSDRECARVTVAQIRQAQRDATSWFGTFFGPEYRPPSEHQVSLWCAQRRVGLISEAEFRGRVAGVSEGIATGPTGPAGLFLEGLGPQGRAVFEVVRRGSLVAAGGILGLFALWLVARDSGAVPARLASQFAKVVRR